MKSFVITFVVILFFASLFLTPLAGVLAGRLMDYYPGVIERMNQCEKAEELLGKDPRLSKIGFNYGFAKIEGAYGRVSWRFPVKGDSDSGSFKFYLERHSSVWQMISGFLTVGDQQVEVVSCKYYEEKEGAQVR